VQGIVFAENFQRTRKNLMTSLLSCPHFWFKRGFGQHSGKIFFYCNTAITETKLTELYQIIIFFQDHESLLVDGICQIPDPLYKLIGSIVSFYVPLIVMMVTYALTVRLLARQQQSLGMVKGWTGVWLSSAAGQAMGKCLILFQSNNLVIKLNLQSKKKELPHPLCMKTNFSYDPKMI